MAPEPPNQKRKRGGPPGASKVEESATSRDTRRKEAANDAPEGDEVDLDDQTRPKKRGRKKVGDATDQPASALQDTAQPARRGRSAKAPMPNLAEEENAEVEEADTRQKKRANQAQSQSPEGAKGRTKTTWNKGPAHGEPPSSTPRRSQRERRVWDPEIFFSAQRDREEPEVEGTQEEQEPDPRPRPKKRGSPLLDEDPASNAHNQGTQSTREPGEKKKRGRSSLNNENTESIENVAQARQPRKSKVLVEKSGEDQASEAENAPRPEARRRGRPIAVGTEPSPPTDVEDAPQPWRRVRPKAVNTRSSPPAHVEDAPQPPRRGRQKASKAEPHEKSQPSHVENDVSHPRSQARQKPSKAGAVEQSPALRADGESQSRRRDRPKQLDARATEPRQAPVAEALNRRGPRRSSGEAERAAPVQKQAKSRSEAAESEAAQLVASEARKALAVPYRRLKAGTRNITRSTISAKWSPLDSPSINVVRTFLADAQRPVLHRLQDSNRRREHASSALSIVSRRLQSKLVKGFPFPAPTASARSRTTAGSHESEFNFERTVDAIQSLENNLNPLLHSVTLLEREIQKEEAALEKEYATLQTLEANARSETKAWRERGKRDHVLVPGMKRNDEQDDTDVQDPLQLVAKVEDGAVSGLFTELQDDGLVMLSKQIGSHMESMKGNLQQIDGVVPAITKSKAALQQVLHKHLEEEQYESILFG